MSPTQPEQTPPPVGEEIHLPGPTLLPFFNAVGITVAIIGITTSIFVLITGLLIFLYTTARWIADTRRDISELPLEHSHGPDH